MNIFVKAWFFVDKELIEVANILTNSLRLQEFVHDGEDTWEWCLWDKDEIIYDISRKHNRQTGIYDYPVGVYVRKDTVELTEVEYEHLGRSISKALNVKVYLGEVSYIEGNEFEFHPHRYIEENS